jgi:hypothetical protein
MEEEREIPIIPMYEPRIHFSLSTPTQARARARSSDNNIGITCDGGTPCFVIDETSSACDHLLLEALADLRVLLLLSVLVREKKSGR